MLFSSPEGSGPSSSRGRAPSAPAIPPRPVPRWKTEDPDHLTALADEIASLTVELTKIEHRLLVAIADFDEREGWARAGFATCEDWLAWWTGIGKGTASDRVRVARQIAHLPKTSEAMARGDLSYSKVRAIARAGTPENEPELLELAAEVSASALERSIRAWRIGNRKDEAELERIRHNSRSFTLFRASDGAYEPRGRLDPEVGALLMRAIDAAMDAQFRSSMPEATAEQRRADAIGLVAERALATGFGGRAVDASARDTSESADNLSAERTGAANAYTARVSAGASTEIPISGSRAERYQVMLHVDVPSITELEVPDDHRCELEDGTRLSGETARRLTCDASVVRVLHAPDGKIIDIDRKTRTISPALRRALDARDRGCRFPGCGSRFTDAHHIRHWADGGATRADNLVLLCQRHHRLLHEGGFGLEITANGGLMFLSPRGFGIPEVPPKVWMDDKLVQREGGAEVLEWEEDIPVASYLAWLSGVG